jgi:hypothetical protein
MSIIGWLLNVRQLVQRELTGELDMLGGRNGEARGSIVGLGGFDSR